MIVTAQISCESHDGDDIFDYDDDVIGPLMSKRNRDISEAERIMHAAGWFDKSPNGVADVGDLTPVVPSYILSGKDWKNIVLKKKQLKLDERHKHMNNTVCSSHNSKIIQSSNEEVKIVDKTYLTRDFKINKDKDINIMNETVQLFKLNKEQERAFRIVANHATLDNPEQLKMYLGGMGGTGKSQVIKALINYFDNRNEPHRIIVVAPLICVQCL